MKKARTCYTCKYFKWLNVRVRKGTIQVPYCMNWEDNVDRPGDTCEDYQRKGGKKHEKLLRM